MSPDQKTAQRASATPTFKGTMQVASEARDNDANFARIQHMLHHLAPHRSMALLLANGSMSSGFGGAGEIRRALIEADLPYE